MDSVFKCDLCKKSFVSLSGLCQHTEMSHSSGEIKACLDAQPEPLEIVDDRRSDVLNPPPSDLPLDEKEGFREEVLEGKDARVVQRPNSPIQDMGRLIEDDHAHPLIGIRFRNLHEQMLEMKQRLNVLEEDRKVAQELQDMEDADAPDLQVRPLDQGFAAGVDAGVEALDRVRDQEYEDERKWAVKHMYGASLLDENPDMILKSALISSLRLARQSSPCFFTLQIGILIGYLIRCARSLNLGKILRRMWCLLPIFLMFFIFMRLPTSKACFPTAEAFDVIAMAENPTSTSLLSLALLFATLYAVSWITYKAGVGAKNAVDAVIDHMSSKANQVVSSAMKNAAKTGGEILLNGSSHGSLLLVDSSVEKPEAMKSSPDIKLLPDGPSANETPIVKNSFIDIMSWISDLALIIAALQAVYEATRNFFSSPKKEELKKEALQSFVDVAAVAMTGPAFVTGGWSSVMQMMKYLFNSLLALNTLARGSMTIFGCVFPLPSWVKDFQFPDFESTFSMFPRAKQAGFGGWFADFYKRASLRLQGRTAGSNDDRLLALQRDEASLLELENLSDYYYHELPKHMVSAQAMKDFIATDKQAQHFIALHDQLFSRSSENVEAVPAEKIFREVVRFRRVMNEKQAQEIVDGAAPPLTIRQWLSRVLNLREDQVESFKTPIQIALLVAFVVFCAYLWWALNPKKSHYKKDDQKVSLYAKESDLGKRGYEYKTDDDVNIRDEERRFKYEEQKEEERLSQDFEGADEGDMHYNRKHKRELQTDTIHSSHDSRSMRAAKAAQLRVQQQAEEQALRAKYGKSWADWQDEEEAQYSKEARSAQELEQEISERKKRVDAALAQLSEVEQKLIVERKVLIAEQDKIIRDKQALAAQFVVNQNNLASKTKQLSEVRENETSARSEAQLLIAPLLQELAKLREEVKENKAARAKDTNDLSVAPEEMANKIRAVTKEAKLPCQVCLQVASHSVDWKKGKLRDAVNPFNALLKQCKKETHLFHYDERNLMFNHIKKNQRAIQCPFGAKCQNGEGKCKWLCHAHPSVVNANNEPLIKLEAPKKILPRGKFLDEVVPRSAYTTANGVQYLPYVLSHDEQKYVMPATITQSNGFAKEARVTSSVTQLPLEAHLNAAYIKCTGGHSNCTIVASSALVPLHWWRLLTIAQKSECEIIWGSMKVMVASLTKYEFEKWEDGSEADILRIMLPLTWRIPQLKMLPFDDLQIGDRVDMAVWRQDPQGVMVAKHLFGSSVGKQDGYGMYQINTENLDCGSPVMKSLGESWRIVGIHNITGSSVTGCIYLDDSRWKQLMTPKNVSLGQSQRQ